jgi:S1-C subfamily serine protease
MKPLAITALFFGFLSAYQCPAQSSGSATAQEQQFIEVVKHSISSVVFIEVQDASGSTTRTGSGFMVSPDGKIVTNFHVIEGARSAYVKMNDGAFFKVDGLIASDKEADLAVLKVAGNDLPALKFGDSDKAMLGQSVIVIGSPLCLQIQLCPQNSVSNGIISGLREDSGRKWIQTTAAASAGNSGGPLLNSSGEVLGVVTWKVVGGENLNFAVPVNSVKSLLAFAGSTVKPLAASRHLKFVPGQAVYIMTNDLSIKRKAEEQFAKDGQFKVAGGLSGADFVFVALWDKSSNEELAVAVLPDDYSQYKTDLDGLRDHALWQGGGQVRPGSIWNPTRSEVKVLVRQFEQEASLVTPSPAAAPGSSKEPAAVPATNSSSKSVGWIGIHTQSTGDVAVVNYVTPDSPAAKAGVRAGDIILALDGRPLKGKDLESLVAALKPGTQISVNYARGSSAHEVSIIVGSWN